MSLFDSIKKKPKDPFAVEVQNVGSIVHRDLLVQISETNLAAVKVYSVKYFKKPEIGAYDYQTYSEYMEYCHFMVDEIGVDTLEECLETDSALEHGEHTFSKMIDVLDFVQDLLEDCSD